MGGSHESRFESPKVDLKTVLGPGNLRRGSALPASSTFYLMEWTQPHFLTSSISGPRWYISTICNKKSEEGPDDEGFNARHRFGKEHLSYPRVDFRGAVVLRRQLTRKQLLPFLARLEPCLVGMEACAGAHYWAREIEKLGHTARLMSPHFITAYRKSQKNDGNDAEAVCEAVGRPSMRFVTIKSAPQQDIQALHRIRFQLIKWRTALANEIRGLLGEYGIVMAKGIAPLRCELPLILDDGENQLSGLFREMLGEMAERLNLLDQRIRQYDSKVEHVFGQDKCCRRLARVEGVGALVATALVAAVGNAHEFKNGRESQRLAWPGAAATFQRWPQCTLGYQQARRSLPAHIAHSRSSLHSTRGRKIHAALR